MWSKDGQGGAMRLIDADALINTLNEEKINFIADINYIILNAPTVEAEHVRHGHWIEYEPDNGIHFHKCSECGKRDMYQGTFTDWNGRGFSFYYKRQYCPVCGAKMDEVEE